MSALWTSAKSPPPPAAPPRRLRSDRRRLRFARGRAGRPVRRDEGRGHRRPLFVDKAFAAGAAGALVSEPIAEPHVLVADTTKALNDLGRAARARTSARICGVTGSVGKTGTKEALYAALDRRAGRAHRSVKSYNNHTGVPLSLARMPRERVRRVRDGDEPQAGELAALTRLVRPHVAIVTAIAPAHREFFASDEEIADAKAEIFQGLEPGGTAIIPYDSPHRDRLIPRARRHAGAVVTFGLGEQAPTSAPATSCASARRLAGHRPLPEAELTFTISPAGRALGVERAGRARRGRGGRRRPRRLPASRWPSCRPQGPGRAAPDPSRRRRGPADRRKLQCQSGLDGGDPEGSARRRWPGRRIAVLGDDARARRRQRPLPRRLAAPLEAAQCRLCDPGRRRDGGARESAWPKGRNGACARRGGGHTAGPCGDRPGDAMLVKGSNSIGLAALVEALAGGTEPGTS
jgi:UDP-N-acetylmuramoyl-tripeptide--D-alanyl-D-alanine ligase